MFCVNAYLHRRFDARGTPRTTCAPRCTSTTPRRRSRRSRAWSSGRQEPPRLHGRRVAQPRGSPMAVSAPVRAYYAQNIFLQKSSRDERAGELPAAGRAAHGQVVGRGLRRRRQEHPRGLPRREGRPHRRPARLVRAVQPGHVRGRRHPVRVGAGQGVRRGRWRSTRSTSRRSRPFFAAPRRPGPPRRRAREVPVLAAWRSRTRSARIAASRSLRRPEIEPPTDRDLDAPE